jgi:hypothetical protein
MIRSLTYTSLFAAACALALGQTASASYVKVFGVADANTGGVVSPFLNSVVTSGGTAYATISNSTGTVQGAVSSFNGSTFATVMPTSGWSGPVDPNAAPGAAVVGTKLRTLLFTPTNAIWEVDLGAGTSAEAVSSAAITAGAGTVALTTPFEVTPAGDIYLWSSATGARQIVQITAGNVVTTEIPTATITSVFGSATAGIQGLGVSGNTLYLGSNTTDTIVAWDIAGNTATTALSTAAINSVVGGTTAGFGDIFAAPNGLVYFRETVSDAILSFNPANPSGTLSVVLTGAQLSAGPAGSTNVGQLSWWNGNLSWTVAGLGTAASAGFYAIPEPTSAMMVALSLMGLGARRRG